ncbi:MAG: ParA family protein [Rhodospirillaceae bacterium]|nr:ParA family protein [Rhodospirillaceae bacterium]
MRKPVRITVFNHKGGVGKTTLTANIAFALALSGKSVLLVDSDPQCNLTSYLLSDDVVDDLLNNSNTPTGQTIWSAVHPVLDNIGIGRLVDPIMVGDIALLPGDIRLSEFEEFLGDAWADGFRRRLGALRATSSISDLVSRLGRQQPFDFVFYDTGPNIGPLNRVILLDSDFFVVPVACDLFSVRALATLGQTVKKWILDTETISSIAPDDAEFLKGTPAFLGYIPQRFRVYGQQMTKEADVYLRRIKERVDHDVSSVLRAIDGSLAPRSRNPILGAIPDISTLVQRAQREGVAIWKCSVRNGEAKASAQKSFTEIADRIDHQCATHPRN